MIVRFVRREAKFEFLAKTSTKPSLTAKDLDLDSPNRVFVRKDFTKRRADLFFKSRQIKRTERNPTGKIKYVWTRNGEINMKREEETKIIKMTYKEDLRKL